MKVWFKSGSPWIWLTSAAVSACLILVFGLLGLIAVRGMGHFWPADVHQFEYQLPGQAAEIVVGELADTESVPIQRIRDAGIDLNSDELSITRSLIKTGNRDVLGVDHRWIVNPLIQTSSKPEDFVVIERREWGNFYGTITAINEDGKVISAGKDVMAKLRAPLDRTLGLVVDIHDIERGEIGAINYDMERLRLKEKGLELDDELTPAAIASLAQQRSALKADYEVLQQQLVELYKEAARDSIVVRTSGGQPLEIKLTNIVRIYQPNAMSVIDKCFHYAEKFAEFTTDEPREANTEGGIFPAIFGTVMMVMIMAVIVTPFGIIAAVYLREYATQGPVTRTIRIAVNNLAGVPSIVYGVFGLGFFVYFIGGSIDQLLFPESLPAPTFGTPGILWASLTLAILTLPVVIVATEEGLARIPRSIREGSLALGATKAETLWRTIIPMASPAMMTGMILAVARAAGEVAPLMLVGVVKLAPSLPMDGNFPFLHLDRKFMHLGFHIYDVGFQSPNVEAARPLVYATAFVLVAVILLLNIVAIWIRNRLREQYRGLET